MTFEANDVQQDYDFAVQRASTLEGVLTDGQSAGASAQGHGRWIGQGAGWFGLGEEG